MSGEGEAEGVQEPQETGGEEQNGQDSTGHVAALHALKQAYVDAHESDGSKDAWRAFREYLTIVLVLITVVFTGLTYCIFRQTMLDASDAAKKAHADNVAALHRTDIANQQTRDFFQRAQEPVLWETDNPKYIVFDEPQWFYIKGSNGRGVIGWNVHVFNYGNGVAFNVSESDSLEISGGPSCGSKHPAGFGAAVPPKGSYFFTVPCARLWFSNAMFKKLSAQDRGITLHSAITYTDAFGNRYETDFCWQHLGTGVIQFCRGNSVYRR